MTTLSAVGAHAQWSSGQSVFTTDGVEIAVDARVFALYAMLNAQGYDVDEVRGPAPLFRPSFTEARKKVRAGLGRPGQGMRALGAVLEKNPVPVDRYLAAALELGTAPDFTAGAQASPLAKALSGPMRQWFNEEGGAQLLRAVADEAKATQKTLLPKVDAAARQATALVRLGDAQEQLLDDNAGPAGRVVVVLNDLDGHGTLQRVTAANVTFVVAGPARSAADEEAIVTAATVAYARGLVARDVEKGAVPGSLVDTYATVDEKVKAALPDPKGFAVELVACAFAQAVREGAACAGSPLSQDPNIDAQLKVLAPRVKAFAGDTRTLNDSVATLLATAPAATPSPAAPAPAQKGKKADTKR